MAEAPLELKFDGTTTYGWADFARVFRGDGGTKGDEKREESQSWPSWFADRERKAPVVRESKVTSAERVAVYARVRPLLAAESERGVGVLAGIAQSSSDPSDSAGVALRTEAGLEIGGFAGVLGPEATNEAVFARALAPRLDTVLRGGTASLFCYGYTGGGKTHTALGYGGEPGLFELGARALLERLPGGRGLLLHATAVEIYGDTVSDLLGAEKVKCLVRKDEQGALQIRGPATSIALEGLPEPPQPPEGTKFPDFIQFHSTLATADAPLRASAVRSADDVRAVTETSIRMRAVGNSSEHKQSSRSHAMVQMEIVTDAFVTAREDLAAKRARIPALRNAVDNMYLYFAGSLMDMSAGADGVGEGKTYRWPLRVFDDPEEWGRRRASLAACKAALVAKCHSGMREVMAAEEELQRLEEAEPLLGGVLALVDLAGADYDKRDVGKNTTAAERKESTAINKSLLALKNCLRAIAKVPGAPKRPPFRESQLTRILEHALQPRSGTSESVGVMLLAVSPADHIERMTVNTLRYGQILAARGNKKAAARAAAGGSRVRLRSKLGGAPASPEVLEELQAIYAEHCPEKSAADVAAILERFKGREAKLLHKVRQKYGAVALVAADAAPAAPAAAAGASMPSQKAPRARTQLEQAKAQDGMLRQASMDPESSGTSASAPAAAMRGESYGGSAGAVDL